LKEKLNEVNSSKDKMTSEYIEKIRNRDLIIEKNNEELKHLKSTVRGQENSISYFKKKVDELNKLIQDEKSERMNLQSEMRRMEHLSSKASSPRNNDDYDDFDKEEAKIKLSDENKNCNTEGSQGSRPKRAGKKMS
jgi:predicted RNase H-like nuclease (RuvC/YqgF family)